MKTSLFYSITTRLFTLSLLCAGYALLHAASFAPILPVGFDLLTLNAFIDALLFCGLALALRIIMKYGNFAALSRYQQFINYAALGLLTVGLWLGLGYLASCLLFDQETVRELSKEIPPEAFTGILAYTIIMQYFHVKTNDTDNADAEKMEQKDTEVRNKNGDPENIDTLERITVKIGQKIHMIFVSDIIYIRSDGDYVQIYTGNSRYVKDETMKYFETHLPRQQFVRVHRSYIVNVEMILRIELFEKQNQLLVLKNGDRIKASAAGYKTLRETLNL